MLDTPIAAKLGIKPSYKTLVLNAPGGYVQSLGLPEGVEVKADVTRDTGWDVLRSAAIRPVSLIALDDTWSTLRFRTKSEVKPRA